MSYTPPAGNAVNFSWVGAASYTPPAGDSVNFSWVTSGTVQARIAVPGPLCAPALLGESGAAIEGRLAVPGPLGLPALLACAAIAARLAIPGPLAAPQAQVRVVRYRLSGEVRLSGVLVDRRVRAYRRSDGALVAQADTAAGRFALDVGFSADEYTVIPVDLATGATDYTPPAANRVMSVLAQDTP